MERRIPELDGLRGLAIAAVLLYHLWPRENGLHPLFRGGWIGVELFFVLSGFLITSILLKQVGQPNYYRRFYWRRFLRIFPLYYALLAGVTALMVALRGVGYLNQIRAEWGSLGWFVFFAGNFPTAWHAAWPPQVPFLPLWSLQIEEQFYLLYPAIVAFAALRPGRLKHALWTGVAVSLIARCVAWWFWPANAYAPYVLTICRMDSLAFGGLLAISQREKTGLRIQGWWLGAGAAALGTAAFLFGDAWQENSVHTWGITLLGLWFAGCVGWALQNTQTAKTVFLRWRPLTYLGTISYGVYLLHMSVAFVIRMVLHQPAAPANLTTFVITTALSIAAGAVSWHLFESRLLSWGHPRSFEKPAALALVREAPALDS